MKLKHWWWQIPIVLFFSGAFLLHERGVRGIESNSLVHNAIFPTLRRFSSYFTDWKFKWRGPTAPRQKIVIVEIDSASLNELGRWPWHRDYVAYLVHRLFQSGAKLVGLDIVFSEPDPRVPEELATILEKKRLGALVHQFDSDGQLEAAISKYAGKLVLAWGSESACQPRFSSPDQCPVARPDLMNQSPPDFLKFRCSQIEKSSSFAFEKTPILSAVEVISNIPEFDRVARHSGNVNSVRDPDGITRRASLVTMVDGQPYPSLALELARLAEEDSLRVKLGSDDQLESLTLLRANRALPVHPTGVATLNYRGGPHQFPYVSARDIFREDNNLKDDVNRRLAGLRKSDVFNDAIVLVGVTALAVHDIAATPFSSHMPGVEIHATLLDNLLSGDLLNEDNKGARRFLLAFGMTVGMLTLLLLAERLEALPVLLLFLGTLGGVVTADLYAFSHHGQNWDTGFWYLEMTTLVFSTLVVRYVSEERNKKFMRGAFSKYVAPAVVDAIARDHSQLVIGGHKKQLTLLFSDIRGFTTFAESMDAKLLGEFLNDYFTIMTGIVFAHGGTLDKYIGDALMAFWGAPLEQTRHAALACQAARAMILARAEHHARFLSQYGVNLKIGVGLNTGTVNVGNMGSEDSFNYTAIGDEVNLAARLEGVSKTYGVEVLVSAATLEAIGAQKGALPPHRTLDAVRVKGKKRAVEIAQLSSRVFPPEALRLFDAARKQYRDRQWRPAINQFEAASPMFTSGDGEDGACLVYLERCRRFLETPPPPRWDGSWSLEDDAPGEDSTAG